MAAATCITARDFDALVRKLYAINGLSISANIKHPGTIAERQAIQRRYTIRRDMKHGAGRYVACPISKMEG